MIQKILLSSFFILSSFSIFAQDVPQEQRTLITKVTASWCPPCGGWAWTMFEDMIADNEEKAVLLAAHYSGNLITPAAENMAQNFGAVYQPIFFLGNENQNVSSSTAAAKRTTIKEMVDANFLETPIANAGMNATLDGNNLSVQTKAKFFQAAEGEYYLGVYVVENELVGYQASRGNDAVHEKVIRASMTSDVFGNLLMNGTIAADTEFDQTFEMTLDDTWNTEHLEIVSILWKKEGDKFEFVNTNLTSEFGATTSNVNVLLQNVEMAIQPNVVSTQSVISIDLEKDLRAATLSIFDLNGKKVAEVFSGNLTASNTTFTINKNSVPSAGMYFLVLEAEQKVLTQKVIFE